jgi:type IV pilus assembly protein PilN
MTRINLLPIRAGKKKETVNQQVAILLASTIGVAAVLLIVYGMTVAKVKTTAQEITSSQQEIELLKKKIGEIDNLKKLQAEVKKKLDVLSQLRREKSGPANRMAILSDTVPEKLWLTKYTENGVNVSISGIAFNEDLIATFMRNLQGSEEYGTVELQVSEQSELSGTKVKKFDLTCVLKKIKKDEPPTKK